jgi:hypothetical protein
MAADESWEDDDFHEFRTKPATTMESDDDDEFAAFGVPAAGVASSASGGEGATDDFAFGSAGPKPPPLDDDDDEFRREALARARPAALAFPAVPRLSSFKARSLPRRPDAFSPSAPSSISEFGVPACPPAATMSSAPAIDDEEFAEVRALAPPSLHRKLLSKTCAHGLACPSLLAPWYQYTPSARRPPPLPRSPAYLWTHPDTHPLPVCP